MEQRVFDMTEENTLNLQLRLKNCLQTILELEPDLEQLELGHVLLKEYSLLKTFIGQLEQITLFEEDVRRIEEATVNFLEELRVPLSSVKEQLGKHNLLQ